MYSLAVSGGVLLWPVHKQGQAIPSTCQIKPDTWAQLFVLVPA